MNMCNIESLHDDIKTLYNNDNHLYEKYEDTINLIDENYSTCMTKIKMNQRKEKYNLQKTKSFYKGIIFLQIIINIILIIFEFIF